MGTGEAQSFRSLAEATFEALGLPSNIVYIDMPEHLREKYQYYTRAEMGKLKEQGYVKEFYSLTAGVKDYVCGYLDKDFKIY